MGVVLTVLIGVGAALVYGSSDFFGGMASKRTSPLTVVAMSAWIGLAVMALLSLFVPSAFSAEALLWGALSGIAGSAAILTLYAALAIGPMSILSPLTAVVSAIVPMTWGLVQGERLAPIGYAALAVALVAVVLVGFVPDRSAVRPTPRGLGIAAVSGVLIGVFLVLMDQTPDDSGLLPLIANRSVSGVALGLTLLVVVLLGRRRRAVGAAPGTGGWRAAIPFVLVCGVLDATANALMLLGLRVGDLTVMSVLVALYPAGTIALAAIVLRERIAPLQWVGLALGLGASGMLALA